MQSAGFAGDMSYASGNEAANENRPDGFVNGRFIGRTRRTGSIVSQAEHPKQRVKAPSATVRQWNRCGGFGGSVLDLHSVGDRAGDP